MEVDVGIEVFAVKVIELLSPLSWNMAVAKMLADDSAILGFC